MRWVISWSCWLALAGKISPWVQAFREHYRVSNKMKMKQLLQLPQPLWSLCALLHQRPLLSSLLCWSMEAFFFYLLVLFSLPGEFITRVVYNS